MGTINLGKVGLVANSIAIVLWEVIILTTPFQWNYFIALGNVLALVYYLLDLMVVTPIREKL